MSSKYDMDVIVEIPFGCQLKYEWDKDAGRMRLDRLMTKSMTYPGNYGFIDNTISGDGDPIDVLIVNTYPFYQGSIVQCRVIGALLTTDEKGNDEKIIAVPVCDKNLSQTRYTELPLEILKSVELFFTHYKDIDINKWVLVNGYVDRDEAMTLIETARNRYAVAMPST